MGNLFIKPSHSYIFQKYFWSFFKRFLLVTLNIFCLYIDCISLIYIAKIGLNRQYKLNDFVEESAKVALKLMDSGYRLSGPSVIYSVSLPHKHLFKPVFFSILTAPCTSPFFTPPSTVQIRGLDFHFVPHHCEVFPQPLLN